MPEGSAVEPPEPTTTYFAVVPEWILFRASATAVKVYAVLDRHADKKAEAFPGRARIAELSGMSVSTVKRAVAELEEIGAIERFARTREDGSQTSNRYRLRRDPPDMAQARSAGEPAPRSASEPARNESLLEPEVEVASATSTAVGGSERTGVASEWLSHPDLVRHRESYFNDSAILRKIDRALSRYGADDVRAAISAYAHVLASPEHFWSHRWTLGDFLQRGLDKFVPEARPLENYRARDGTTKSGDRAMTLAEMRRSVAEAAEREGWNDRGTVESNSDDALRGLPAASD